jgi:hypothetical protein
MLVFTIPPHTASLQKLNHLAKAEISKLSLEILFYFVIYITFYKVVKMKHFQWRSVGTDF